MVSPQSERFAMTPSSGGRVLSTPASRVSQSPLSDSTIWRRLKEAGFDEESIKRRDKAALIAYIAKLEAEVFDHQHHMGLLILERKEWASKYEQLKASAELAELHLKRDQAAHLSALSEARKREDSLKKALGVEKECIANIEKAMHEMRGECAETKVAAESKMSKAHAIVEDAQKKLSEAELKLHEAESLQAEASRYHHAAERKLQEVESREDDHRRRVISFKLDCDAKENEIRYERQVLHERQKILQQGQERLLDGQALLNQREDYIFSKSQELNLQAKELDASKVYIENERKALNEEKSNLDLGIASLSIREENLIKREAMLNKKEQELLILQEKIASKEVNEVQRLEANHEAATMRRMSEFEAELEAKRKLVEDEIETKRRAWELREVDLGQREDLISEREHDLEVQSRALTDKENDLIEKFSSLEGKEKAVNAADKEVELKKMLLQKEKEEINIVKLDLEKSLTSLEDRRKQVDSAKENLESMKSETSELLILETKLKEEIDMVRAEKLELMARADELKMEKAKFEVEWESIDEKREELRKEAERIAEERLTISKFLKDERDSLKLEKETMREQCKNDAQTLCCEREDFMNKMVHERSELFSKMQQEHADFLLDIELQKRELENRIDKRREELESYFREREKAFEQEKKRELEYISSLKETVAKDLEHVASEMKRLETGRVEIKVDRERRDREWAELNDSIEELKLQRQKLEKQRELLHADREDIYAQIEQLKKLEKFKIALDSIAPVELQQSDLEPTRLNDSAMNKETISQNGAMESYKRTNVADNGNGHRSASGSPSSAQISWIKRCANIIFKQSPQKSLAKYGERSLISDDEDVSLMFRRQLDGQGGQISNGNAITQNDFSERPAENSHGEPKVIREVPSAGEDANSMYNETNDKVNSVLSFSGQGLLAGRKRRIKNSSTHDWVDTWLEEGQAVKKRRQEEDVTEQTITHCVVSTQVNTSEVEAASMNPTEEISEQANLLKVDKIIEVSEVISTNTSADNAGFQDDSHYVQNCVAALEEDLLQGGATSGNANSSSLGNGGPKAHGMEQEVTLADVEHFPGQSQRSSTSHM